MNHFYRGKGLRALPKLVLAAAMGLSVAACNTDEIVAVEDPEQLRPEQLEGAGSIPALMNGALRQLVGGYSGFGDDAFVSSVAVLTDEWYYGDTFTTRQAADLRTLQPPILGNISDPAYSRLHQARLNARRAFATIAEFTTSATAATDAVNQAQMRTIEGYTFVTLSEGWCGNVPFSAAPETGAIDPSLVVYNAGIGWNAMNDSAVTKYNQALALNANNNLAKVGKGRALINLGRYAEAEAAVATVPDNFVFFLEHSPNTSTQNNSVFSLQSNGRYGISNLEGADTPTGTLRPDAPTNGSFTTIPPTTAPGAEGLPYRGLRDPRIPYRNAGTCFSSSVRCWGNNNFPDFEADMPLASGVEARLIEAEAAYQRGDFVTMLAKLNALRATASTHLTRLYPRAQQVFPAGGVPTLAPLTDPGTAAGRRDMIFTERALWLYNTGHRLGDLRRLVRNYGLSANSVFPSGTNFRGGTFGTDVNYSVPFVEENNPQFKRDQCVTSAA